MGEKGIDCIFIGYAEHSITYRFYVIEPIEYVSIHTVMESRDAIFDETHFSSIPRPNDVVPFIRSTTIGDLENDHEINIPEIRRSKRMRKRKSYGSDFQLYLVEGFRDSILTQTLYCYSVEDDPKTFNDVMKSHDSGFWREAINDEMKSIMGNNTWVLSDLPHGCAALGSK